MIIDKFYWREPTKVLPTIYDDSLSYYELICKLFRKLNEAIDEINAHSELLAQHTQQINAINTQIGIINGKIAVIEGQLAGHEVRITELEESVESLMGEVEELDTRLTALEEKVTAEGLSNIIKGSDYISVDIGEDTETLVVELDETKLDDEPTEDSDSLVKSGGVYDALADKQDTLTAGNGITLTNGVVAIDPNYVARYNIHQNLMFEGLHRSVISINNTLPAIWNYIYTLHDNIIFEADFTTMTAKMWGIDFTANSGTVPNKMNWVGNFNNSNTAPLEMFRIIELINGQKSKTVLSDTIVLTVIQTKEWVKTVDQMYNRDFSIKQYVQPTEKHPNFKAVGVYDGKIYLFEFTYNSGTDNYSWTKSEVHDASKQNKLTAGEGIRLTEAGVISATGGEGATEIFWAVRGETTADEVAEALELGKLIMCTYSGYNYVLANATTTYFYFSCATTSAVRQLALKKSDSSWQSSSLNLQEKLTTEQLNAVNSGIDATKVAKMLVAPTTTNKEIVGVGTNLEQIRVQIGDGLELDGTTSPYTLKSTAKKYVNYATIKFSIGEGAKYRGMTIHFTYFGNTYDGEVSTISGLATRLSNAGILDAEISASGNVSLTNYVGATSQEIPNAVGVDTVSGVKKLWVKTSHMGSAVLTDNKEYIDDTFGATVVVTSVAMY